MQKVAMLSTSRKLEHCRNKSIKEKLTVCVSQTLNCCDKKMSENIERRKDLFWLTGSDVSIQDQLDLLL
jgi:hypothetical protein